MNEQLRMLLTELQDSFHVLKARVESTFQPFGEVEWVEYLDQAEECDGLLEHLVDLVEDKVLDPPQGVEFSPTEGY